MPSRRKLKKEIKSRTNLLIEDAFIESINGDVKEGAKMDSIIDEVIDERHDLLNKISEYPNNGKRAEIKKHFQGVREQLDKKSEAYDKKIGRV